MFTVYQTNRHICSSLIISCGVITYEPFTAGQSIRIAWLRNAAKRMWICQVVTPFQLYQTFYRMKLRKIYQNLSKKNILARLLKHFVLFMQRNETRNFRQFVP